MANDFLSLLIAASRPFIPFTSSINGQEFSFTARKLSLAESQVVSDTWDSIYSETRAKYDDTTVDTAPIFAQIKRLDAKALAKYIAEADRYDLRQEAAAMHDGASFGDPLVIETTDELVAQRRQDLSAQPLEDLRHLAMERRSHFYASNMASEASARKTATLIIHDSEQKPVFPTIEAAAQLQFDDLVALVMAADKAVASTKLDPLPSAPAPQSVDVEPSPKTSAVG